MIERSRSVSWEPGSRLLMATLWRKLPRQPGDKAGQTRRAAVGQPHSARGDFTIPDVMLTMRPKRREACRRRPRG